MASAPTIWRGSTLCRLPTAIRYVAIGTSERPRRGLRSRRGGRSSGRSAALLVVPGAGPLALALEGAVGAGSGSGSSSSGRSSWASTASAAAMSTAGTSCSLLVVGDEVAETRRSGPTPSASVIASSNRATRVALTSSTVGSRIWRQRLAGGLLDGLQQVALARGDERDRVAGAAGAAGAADAVHVGLGVGGDVVVDDVADPLDVEAAGGDVGGDEDVELAVAQLVDGALALRLDDVAVDRGGREPAGPQLLGELLGLLLGADEDDHPLEVLDLEDPGERVDLLRVGDHAGSAG